jgi:hypothetical protein
LVFFFKYLSVFLAFSAPTTFTHAKHNSTRSVSSLPAFLPSSPFFWYQASCNVFQSAIFLVLILLYSFYGEFLLLMARFCSHPFANRKPSAYGKFPPCFLRVVVKILCYYWLLLSRATLSLVHLKLSAVLLVIILCDFSSCSPTPKKK